MSIAIGDVGHIGALESFFSAKLLSQGPLAMDMFDDDLLDFLFFRRLDMDFTMWRISTG